MLRTSPKPTESQAPIRGVIFDWAGTTIDYGSRAPVVAFISAFAKYGVEITAEEARGPMGLQKRDHIVALTKLPRVAEAWIAAHGSAPGEAEIDAMYAEFIPLQVKSLPDYGDVIPGVVDTVEKLRARGVDVAATTGYNREMLEVVLDCAKAGGFVPDAAFCAEDVAAGRPAPWMIYRSMEALGAFPPESVVNIGDTVPDVESGVNAGAWSVGVTRTGNFQRFDGTRPAVYRCYYTGLLELPASYTELRMVSPDEPACPIDDEQFDVFFYAIEAVASGNSPVSPALVEAPVERTLVVVPHEDFHNQPEVEQALLEVAEGAATLVGFLTARDYARARYGPGSETFQRLDREADRYLAKARLINESYAELARMYAAVTAGTLGRDEALARKADHFAALGDACRAAEAAVSFNTCPAALNNAGLAFDRTYTRFYPAWLDLHHALAGDTAATVAALKAILATSPRTEDDVRAAGRAYLASLPD